MNINLGSYKIYVRVVYKNNRNIYFRFDENTNLLVTCPRNTLDEEIVDLIKKNEPALIKMYQSAVDKKRFNEEFHLLGKKYSVVYDDTLEEVNLNGDFVYAKDKEMLDEYLLEEAKRVLTQEADICAKCFNELPEYKLKFRKMKSRWGVCNRRDDSITLNTELIKRSIEQIDYVIIHEMAHFYEGNHSRAFWDIVQAACPDYKKRRAELKK